MNLLFELGSILQQWGVTIASFLQEWQATISGIGTLILTTGLVYLYKRQTNIQENQQELLKSELNREVRRGHTEILRERIRYWHGDLEEVGSSGAEPWISDDTRLPSVRGADVEPAPPSINQAIGESEFRVIPEDIEDDRFLKDLLENHADDLQNLKTNIEQQYEEFDRKRVNFQENCPPGEVIETDEFVLEPMSAYTRWLFERAVLLNRENSRKDKEKMKRIVESRLPDSVSGNSENGSKFYSPKGLDGGKSTYQAIPKSGNIEDLDEYDAEIEEALIRIHNEAIENIGSDGHYEYAVEAAQILDEMAKSIQELKGKLVEYEGQPIFLGDCEYLEEVTI